MEFLYLMILTGVTGTIAFFWILWYEKNQAKKLQKAK